MSGLNQYVCGSRQYGFKYGLGLGHVLPTVAGPGPLLPLRRVQLETAVEMCCQSGFNFYGSITHH